MSEPATPANVPEWDIADRMRKALRTADLGVAEMANYLGVSRGSVSNWINGRIDPDRRTLRLWALRCGVSYDWLVTGLGPTGRGGETAADQQAVNNLSCITPLTLAIAA
jgi:transcriptional regulator with XRE-family HTH domain